jgi:hypothetical protein
MAVGCCPYHPLLPSPTDTARSASAMVLGAAASGRRLQGRGLRPHHPEATPSCYPQGLAIGGALGSSGARTKTIAVLSSKITSSTRLPFATLFGVEV